MKHKKVEYRLESPEFASDSERLLYLAEMVRTAAKHRRAYTISADLMAVVYEVAAGKDGALEELRDWRL